MTFDHFLSQAWDDHVRDPRGVAARLATAGPLATDEDRFIRLADITHHVWGDHLNDRPGGLAAIDRLTCLAAYRADGPSGQAVRRFVASLRLSDGDASVLDAFDVSDRIRVIALAVSNLTDVDPARTVLLFKETLRLVESSALPATDAVHEDVALMAHDLAVVIERNAHSSSDELALMIVAARTARHHWGLQSDPARIFTADCRLANAWRRAGDLAAARTTAQRCLSWATGGAGTALQRFLSWHAVGLIEREARDDAAFDAASGEAARAYSELDPAGQARHAARRAQLTRA